MTTLDPSFLIDDNFKEDLSPADTTDHTVPQEAGRRREDSAPDLSFAPDDNGILGFLDHTRFEEDIMTPWHPTAAWPTDT